MPWSKAFRFSFLGLLAGSLLCSLLLAGLYFAGARTTSAFLASGVAAGYSFAIALAFGAVPLLLIGAPGYCLLARAGWARYSTALAVGLLPAGVVAVNELGQFAALVALFGGTSGLFTHYFAQRDRASLHANNSSKPTPLRGAA